MKHIDQPDMNPANRDAHVRLAVERSALHAADLALSRWTNDYFLCEPPGLAESVQSRWHAAAQNNFTAWLAAGGFAQADEEVESAQMMATAPPLATGPGWRDMTMPCDDEGHCTGACTI